MSLSAEALSLIDYCPASGQLTWRTTRKGRGCKAGSPAGTLSARRDTSYVAVMIHGKKFYGHRLAWETVNGEIPDGMVIDHIDGDGTNNRINNLRAVTASDNHRNQKMAKNNVTGITGVSWHKLAGKHVAHITGKHLGLFENLFDACCARKSAEYRADFHPNHGRS